MSMYYFHLRDHDTIEDLDGTDLTDTSAARFHADGVARELKFKNKDFMGRAWSRWSMHVHDADGQELFSFPMGDENGDTGRD